MAIFFHWSEADIDLWRDALAAENIDLELRPLESLGSAADVEFAIVWAPPDGSLKTMENLKYIFSIGAGVTHITLDPDYPSNVPIVRLQDRLLVEDMSCHIIHWVLHYHRYYARYRQYQNERKWLRHRYPENSARRVSILGLGQTGQDACRRLQSLGFSVTGWARSQKEIEGVRCLAGQETFDTVVREADILVNLLPLTAETAEILNASVFDRMPKGGFIINCARGSSVDDSALLAALDSGQIEAAALDVFREEPLPDDDPYWSHPAVSVTPHAAAPTNERSAAEFIAAQIRTCLDGGQPAPIVDLARGY
ncbi:MAG: glyoxylate/hydroxypyruvate reductase A [Rhizobiaceae bacterium]|nr:glyoxylate/hydroxypyruvate reductase A [Rhizobiaceae bacterium]